MVRAALFPWPTIFARLPVAIASIVTITIATLIAAERSVAPRLAPVATFVAIAFLHVLARHRGLGLRWLLGMRLGALEALVEDILALLLAELFAAFRRLRPHTVAIHALALRRELLAIGHDDAAVVLGVLEIIFCKHVIPRGLSVPGERYVFLGDMSRRAPNLHIGAVRFKASRKRILIFAIVIVVVPTATAAILLSLPHCL